MGWKRIAIGVFAMLHGIGHFTWFIGAWIPRTELVGTQPWLFSTGVTITSPVGQLMGALSLLVVAGFVAVGVGLLTSAVWWKRVLLASVGTSLVVVVPWWSVSPGSTVINALLANVAFVAIAGVPTLRAFAQLPPTEGKEAPVTGGLAPPRQPVT